MDDSNFWPLDDALLWSLPSYRLDFLHQLVADFVRLLFGAGH